MMPSHHPITGFSIRALPFFLPLLFLLPACQNEPPPSSNGAVPTLSAEQPVTAVPTVTVVEVLVETIEVTVATPEPEPEPDHLVVCLAQEPVSLYPYADDEAAVPIHHAIFENNFTQLNYGYQAQGLEKLPGLADGDARLERVTVSAGNRIVDASDRVVELEIGVALINAEGEIVVFAGEPVDMEQLAVDFTLKPRVWSDGRAVTAVDSVYTFELAATAEMAVDAYLLERTTSYQATGRLGLRWTGLPGFYDETYFLNLWRPLPRHVWSTLSPAELATAEMTNRAPMGDGPFVVESWQPGDRLELRRNAAYYRAAEGLPLLERLTFRFLPQANQLLDELLAGNCDIVPQNSHLLAQITLLLEAEAGGLLIPFFQAGTIYEHIGFGINSYGGYGDNIGRPDWFEDDQVRQAVSMCTNRQEMMEQLLFGRSVVLNSYVPDSHPLAPAELSRWPYDPDRANTLLDELGYELDRDGIRRYPGGPNGEFAGEPFRVRLATTQGNELRQRMTQLFQENLLDCGIRVERESLSAAELFAGGSSANGAAGPIFGRRFDLVAFGWPIDHNLACNLFMSDNVPGPADEINPDHYREAATFGGWADNNYTGWINEAFDAACWDAMVALPGTAVYTSSHQQAMTIFAHQLPVIPLFPRLSVAVVRPEVINFSGDATQPSELYNLYEIGLQP
jgi:peptide/nickel transport system substrate-binding protein